MWISQIFPFARGVTSTAGQTEKSKILRLFPSLVYDYIVEREEDGETSCMFFETFSRTIVRKKSGSVGAVPIPSSFFISDFRID